MATRYTRTAIGLHWLMAFGFFAMFALGFYMKQLSFSPFKLEVYSWHKWAGVTLFSLAVIRVLWRMRHQPPALPSTMSPTAVLLSQLGHYALIFFMFAVPLSGWLMSSAMGFQTVWFGIVPLPDLLDKNKAIAELLATTHLYLNIAFIAAIVGHILAALKHQFIDKDNLLSRMK